MQFDLLTTLSNETYLITAVNGGQVVRFNGERIVTTAGQTVRLYGSGPVLISKGSVWSRRGRFAGSYSGAVFDGASIDRDGFSYNWSGTPDASTSQKRADINSPSYTGTGQPIPIAISGANSAVQYIPLPENHSIWVAYVASSPVLRGNEVALPVTTPEATTLNWTRLNDSTEFQWSGSATVWGAVCLVLPYGETPSLDQKWVPGRGAGGLRFAGEPQVTGLSAVYGDRGGLLNATANFIETELWEN